MWGLDAAICAGGSVVGAFVIAFLRDVGANKPFDPKDHERYRWCSNCCGHLDGHEHGSRRCPARWKSEATGEMTGIKFFKPLTINEWMEREGLT